MPASHPMHTPVHMFELRAQRAALVATAFFFAIGLLGFVPGVTFGLLATSVLQNLVHLAFAFAGVAHARSFERARRYLIGGGFVYLAFIVFGCLANPHGAGNLTVAGPWLNLGIAVAMITVGVVAGHGRSDHTGHFGAGEGARNRSIR